jgi:tRNA(Ile)-lysidine synthetase, N-terminal domain/tRNA(Ile)-lysidine synthetase, C-terminal domain
LQEARELKKPAQGKLGEGDEAIFMKRVNLESRVADFIRQHNLISPGDKVVVGVSGGADSVCLFHLLARWQRELDIKLHVAHLNHQLRGAESEADAEYVADLADSLAIPITIDKRDVAGYRAERNCSIEEAARELRYSFFTRVAGDVGANKVAIGHTRDDQVETILMHILRGTGTFGLRGLEPCLPMAYGEGETALPAPTVPSRALPHLSLRAQCGNLLVIRPLLEITREETLSYCQEHQLEPRVDSSNFSLSFLRNRLRLQLLPLLREYNQNIDQALLRLAEIAKDDSSFIEQQAFELWDEVAKQEGDAVRLDRKKVATLPIALQRQLLRLAAAKILGNTKDIEANHIEAVRNLLSKTVGKRVSLPHSLACWREYDGIVIATEAKQFYVPQEIMGGVNEDYPLIVPQPQGRVSLNVPGETVLSGWRVIANISPVIAVSHSLEPKLQVKRRGSKGKAKQHGDRLIAEFDLHKAGTKLFVRQRQPGDRFQPLGMNTPKKLQDFIVDAKIPLSWRDCIPIICSPEQIIWVAGWRIDDRVKVREATREILRLEFTKSP